jgi:hypothetical protein
MEAHMPKTILVVGHFPTTLQIGQQVLTARGYVEAIETLKTTDFDVIIIPAVCDTTDGHGFLLRLRDFNKERRKQQKPTIPILVHHTHDRVTIVVDGAMRVWNIGLSMCNFGNATFVNTSTPKWENKVVEWFENLDQSSAKVA